MKTIHDPQIAAGSKFTILIAHKHMILSGQQILTTIERSKIIRGIGFKAVP